MGYLHIENSYKNPRILTTFKKLYALEKVHGTSAHVKFSADGVHIFPGGEKMSNLLAYFREHFGLAADDGAGKLSGDDAGLYDHLRQRFEAAGFLGDPVVTVFGEAYGGRMQGMRDTYGEHCRFIAFDVQVGEQWLDVEAAAKAVERLGLDFVPFRLVDATVEAINAERDRPSEVGELRGCPGKAREGVVLRPETELHWKNGSRIIAKHKREEFRETKTPREVDPGTVTRLTEANAIAEEWVTAERLRHVVDKLQAEINKLPNPPEIGIASTRDVVNAMFEDVKREAGDEIVWSREAERAVGTAAAKAFKASLVKRMEEVVK